MHLPDSQLNIADLKTWFLNASVKHPTLNTMNHALKLHIGNASEKSEVIIFYAMDANTNKSEKIIMKWQVQ